MIIVCQKILKNTKINGITLFPFIILRKKSDRGNRVLINHERIHIRQQIELLIFGFYIWYITEYYFWLIKLRNPYQAYRQISFEREAYAMERDLDYLKKRPLWNFRKFVKRK